MCNLKNLSIIQQDLLIGTLLGDGNLQSITRGRTWRYRALHAATQKDYLFHKYEILKPFCGTPPMFSAVFDKRTSKTYQRFYFNTKINNFFNLFGDIFYTFNYETSSFLKDVPLNIEHYLTPRAIAY